MSAEPMLCLRPITSDNWRAALLLTVRPEQLRFVADHTPIAAIVLAKAFVRPAGMTWTPYAIYAQETMVGMLALAERADADERWLYHFFIDQAHQGHGYGRAALRALVALVRADRRGCRALCLTVHPENDRARRLYTGQGFVPAGYELHGEPVYRLPIAESADVL